MVIDGAVARTAVDAWDKRWATSEGRADWLEPHPAVVAILPELHARGARRVLDLGCGVGRHALLLAEHGFDVEAIDGSPAGLAAVRETAAASRPSQSDSTSVVCSPSSGAGSTLVGKPSNRTGQVGITIVRSPCVICCRMPRS